MMCLSVGIPMEEFEVLPACWSSSKFHNAKAACVLIDLCASALAPWLTQVIAKVDLAVELLEDLLGTIQGARHSLAHARAAIKYIVLALSGHMDDILARYKEYACTVALNVIRMAVRKPSVLPSLESEWRRGTVAPSVLLSILDPHMQLPPEIDLCKFPISKTQEQESLKSNSQMILMERLMFLILNKNISESSPGDGTTEEKHVTEKNLTKICQNSLLLDAAFPVEYVNLQADYMQLMNYRDCELRASEFRRLALDLHSQHEISPEGHDAAIDALLLAAECYVNPFMSSFRASSKVINQSTGTRIPQNCDISELRKVFEKNSSDLEKVTHLENKRDKVVLQILLEAAKLDRKYKKKMSDEEHYLYYPEEHDDQVINLSLLDIESADAVTLVRQNQALLCNFLIQRLRREQHSMHEILMQSTLFLLHSATKLFCPPEHVIDIILGSAEYLNGVLTSFYYQLKEGNLRLDPEKLYGVQRRWLLLQKLVIASSGGDEELDFANNTNNCFQYRNLIPPSAWMLRIPTFSTSPSPLLRFLGWMAVSRNAKQYMRERLFLASDLPQLTNLLSIFADELALVDNVVKQNDDAVKIQQSGVREEPQTIKGFENTGQPDGDKSFQLRSLSYSVVPDILCWFSDLCSWPFLQKDQLSTRKHLDQLKGYVAKNAKAIILYILEAIVTEHMEAMVPEIPRVVQVLVSLCKTSYCDVSFLDSILHLLKPIISYSLSKMTSFSDVSTGTPCDGCSKSYSWFLNDVCHDSCPMGDTENLESDKSDAVSLGQKVYHLSAEEITNFAQDLEGLICKLSPTVELCWKLHPQLAKKLTVTSAQCFMYSRIGLEGLSGIIMMLQENHCWEVASMILDCLLGVPKCFSLDDVIGQDLNGEGMILSPTFCNKLVSTGSVISVSEPITSLLVSRTWDQQLIMFFMVWENLGIRHVKSPLVQLSLALIAAACLYSPAEDISLIPQDVWRNIEALGMSRTGGLGDLEKKACQALCRLRNEGDDAKEVLKEVLSSTSSRQPDPNFGSTRQSILQV
ncbi:hypothetical protein CK203_099975 [Vitis vinifera]|uniref:Uncharacterized protein n=1 Tax=Vitis vinifera TaxID=29760 RepID=A0A438CIQ5_VITVI|nr:hypothetical protein CK203_099975 [Vitis vinifera]